MSKLERNRKKTGGRAKGTPNKTTALLKEAVLQAAADAHNEGMVGYLTQQAKDNPVAFMSLLGKVLPMQVTGEDGGPVPVSVITRVIVSPRNHDVRESIG